ncbi:MAG TPA: YitT family protein [Symbiobacteriaceae bacterium]|nr:YitT family protein [Symbiobacteriaceae bacterium]
MRNVMQAILVVVGAAMVAAGYNLFFIPHHLVSGGVAGVALLIYQLFKLPVGLQVLIYNIPILWWAWKDVGRKFLMLTIVGIGAMTLFLSLIPIRAVVVDDPMLNSIFGGLVVGLGVGIAMRAGGSCGGLDVAAVAFNRRWSIPMGDIMLGFNAIIIFLAGMQGDLKAVLYTLIAIFVNGKMVDVVTSGTVKKTVMIVSPQADAIARRINEDMGRGATMLDATGAYSQQTRHVIFCVVTRLELSQVKEIALGVDGAAFVVVLETDQVIGRFRNYNVLTRTTKPIS